MPKLRIISGTKLDLQLVGEGQSKSLLLKSTFEKNVDDVSFLVSAPIHQGKFIIFDEATKVSIKYYDSGSTRILFGCIDEYVKIGVRNYLKIHMLSVERQFFQRADERIKASLKVVYMKAHLLSNNPDKKEKMYAIAKDISVGGIALKINHELEPEQIIEINLPPLGRMKGFSQDAEVRWVMAIGQDKSFSHLVGLRFVFDSNKEKENMRSYVSVLIEMKK